jgi:hypothetical protein
MKKIFVVLIFLSACMTATRETVSDTDTTTVSLDSLRYLEAVESVPFTIKEEVRLATLPVFGKNQKLSVLLPKLYGPDEYTSKAPDDAVGSPKYIVTEAVSEEGTYVGLGNKCYRKSMVLATRGDYIDHEFYDLFVLNRGKDGRVTLGEKLVFDGSEGQSSTIVTVSKEALSSEGQCDVLKVSSATEGGDLNLHRHDWIEFYIANEKSLHRILRLEMEQTDIQDFEASQTENQNSSSEVREYTVQETSHHGLFDIRVHHKKIENGNLIFESDELYEFNGQLYIEK